MSEAYFTSKRFCNTCDGTKNHFRKSYHNRIMVFNDMQTVLDQVDLETAEEYIARCENGEEDYINRLNESLEVCRFEFWYCIGCDTTFMEEDLLLAHNKDEIVWSRNQRFPKANIVIERRLKEFNYLNEELAGLYWEVIESYNEGMFRLSAIGLRALLEGICNDLGIGDEMAWGLNRKLKIGVEQQIFPQNIFDALMKLKIMGDKAAHRMDGPDTEELSLAIDLAEDLMDRKYETKYKLESSAERLKNFPLQEDDMQLD